MPRLLQLEFYRHDPDHPGSLSPNAVNAMYSAPDGTLYAGTVEGGLNCLMPHSDHFIHYTTANSGLPHNSVSALTADSKGNLWIGTWGSGLAVMNLQHPGQISRILTEGKYHDLLYFVGALAYDGRNDGMWIGTNAGLFFYDLKRKQLEIPFPEALSVRGCIGSLITRDGRLLMGEIRGYLEVDLKSRHSGKRFLQLSDTLISWIIQRVGLLIKYSLSARLMMARFGWVVMDMECTVFPQISLENRKSGLLRCPMVWRIIL